MPGETPDYHRLSASAIRYPVTDLGELAARLGALPSSDRRGDVSFLDSFESGLGAWLTSTVGSGSIAALSLLNAKTGRFSALLDPAAVASSSAAIQRRVPLPPATVIGVEFSLQFRSNVERVELTITRFSGSFLANWGLRFDDANDRIEYLNSAGTWTLLVSGVGPLSLVGTWHSLKLVADIDSAQYVRAIVDETEYSLLAVDAEVAANVTAPSLVIAIFCYGSVGNGGAVLVDDVIFTENEPA